MSFLDMYSESYKVRNRYIDDGGDSDGLEDVTADFSDEAGSHIAKRSEQFRKWLVKDRPDPETPQQKDWEQYSGGTMHLNPKQNSGSVYKDIKARIGTQSASQHGAQSTSPTVSNQQTSVIRYAIKGFNETAGRYEVTGDFLKRFGITKTNKVTFSCHYKNDKYFITLTPKEIYDDTLVQSKDIKKIYYKLRGSNRSEIDASLNGRSVIGAEVECVTKLNGGEFFIIDNTKANITNDVDLVAEFPTIQRITGMINFLVFSEKLFLGYKDEITLDLATAKYDKQSMNSIIANVVKYKRGNIEFVAQAVGTPSTQTPSQPSAPMYKDYMSIPENILDDKFSNNISLKDGADFVKNLREFLRGLQDKKYANDLWKGLEYHNDALRNASPSAPNYMDMAKIRDKHLFTLYNMIDREVGTTTDKVGAFKSKGREDGFKFIDQNKNILNGLSSPTNNIDGKLQSYMNLVTDTNDIKQRLMSSTLSQADKVGLTNELKNKMQKQDTLMNGLLTILDDFIATKNGTITSGVIYADDKLLTDGVSMKQSFSESYYQDKELDFIIEGGSGYIINDLMSSLGSTLFKGVMGFARGGDAGTKDFRDLSLNMVKSKKNFVTTYNAYTAVVSTCMESMVSYYKTTKEKGAMYRSLLAREKPFVVKKITYQRPKSLLKRLSKLNNIMNKKKFNDIDTNADTTTGKGAEADANINSVVQYLMSIIGQTAKPDELFYLQEVVEFRTTNKGSIMLYNLVKALKKADPNGGGANPDDTSAEDLSKNDVTEFGDKQTNFFIVGADIKGQVFFEKSHFMNLKGFLQKNKQATGGDIRDDIKKSNEKFDSLLKNITKGVGESVGTIKRKAFGGNKNKFEAVVDAFRQYVVANNLVDNEDSMSTDTADGKIFTIKNASGNVGKASFYKDYNNEYYIKLTPTAQEIFLNNNIDPDGMDEYRDA